MLDLHSIARIGLVFSDPTRLRLLAALRGGELCACQLVDLAGLAPSTISKHLSILHAAGIVASRKDGRWVHYRLAENVSADVAQVAKSFLQMCTRCDEIRRDVRRLNAIRRADLEVLCKQQRKK